MDYKNNVTFAIRTLLMYQHTKEKGVFRKYEYTLAAGALLNVISGLMKNNKHFRLCLEKLKDKELPGLSERTVKAIGSYLKKIWGALSKKSEGNNGNFSYEKEDGDIIKLVLHSEQHTPWMELSNTQMDDLLSILDEAIHSQYWEPYETEKQNFDTATGETQ
jgi:hypothetical protein